jgi:hypothetical protein
MRHHAGHLHPAVMWGSTALVGLLLMLAWLRGGVAKDPGQARPQTQDTVADSMQVPIWVETESQAPRRREERSGVGLIRRSDSFRKPEPARIDPAPPGAPREGLRLVEGPSPHAPTEQPQSHPTPTPPVAAPAADTSLIPPDARSVAHPAPFGRVLQCELVFTVESFVESSPLIGLVVEDQWWDGGLVIPAGTEVHGTARVDRQRDRVFSDETWVLVLPRQPGHAHGRELEVSGRALDRVQPSANGTVWGMTDGSLGLRGEVLRSTSPDEARLFAASFLSAAAAGLQETGESALTGESRVLANPRNAALEGSRAVLDRLASRLAEEVARHGSYLQVPAGKQFYLYVTQSIEKTPPR